MFQKFFEKEKIIMNIVALVGRLVREPRTYESEAGTTYFFTLAVQENYYDKNGNLPVNYIEVQGFSGKKHPQKVYNYLQKGQLVGVQGKIVSYKDHDNHTQMAVQINFGGLSLYASPKKTDNGQAAQAKPDAQPTQAQAAPAPAAAPKQAAAPQAQPTQAPQADNNDVLSIDDDDLPF